MAEAALANDPWVTADQLLEMPDDGLRRELVRGEVRVMTPAGSQHGRLAMQIGIRLGAYVAEQGLGTVYAAETGFKLASDPDTVRAPDVAFVTRDRADAVGDTEKYWPGAPDLAVEVLSPDDRYHEVDEKVAEWLGAGCRMVIVVNPRRRAATIYRSPSDVRLLTAAEEIDGGDVVPGWKLPLRELFG
jgi:Uma2 family endonuclease